MAKRAPPVSPGLMLWQVCSGRQGECSNAVGRRLSESRMRENRTYGLRWRGLETWPRWNCEPTLQSKEQDWKPSTYSRRASPRPYRPWIIATAHIGEDGIGMVMRRMRPNSRTTRTRIEGGSVESEVAIPG